MISKESVASLKDQATKELALASTETSLIEVKTSLFGKKGSFSKLMASLGSLEPESRKEFGQFLNKTKKELESSFDAKLSELKAKAEEEKYLEEELDVTLKVNEPLDFSQSGSFHPIYQVQRELEEIFRGLGFKVVDGPEVEREYYNFEALNIPDTHPARDMQDTFWTTKGDLLRTHTSSIQVRTLEKEKDNLPLRIVAPGKVFRYERVDASHSHTFYQMEGMVIDRKVNVSQLIYFMKTLLKEIFGFAPKVRLRPGYFPFVEPGFELDIWFNGKWMELLPCGLVHPKVLEYGGIDSSKWQGFAFGLGLSRLVMSRFEIDDIRHLQASDMRFLNQFS